MKKLLPLLIFLAGCTIQQETSISTGVHPDAKQVDLIVPEHGMADPHAWVQNDTVFIICGHDESWLGRGSFRMDRWEIWSSTNLEDWTFHSSILPKDTYIGDLPNCWAGDICERDGKYYWFFSNRNINTGVVVADQITGPYRDELGEPLLPKGIVPVHAYDPEIYMEDGVYTICFGSGTYYMATLAEDMMSLETEPTPILVKDDEGKKMGTGDKSTLFKRDGWYYLVWGSKYAMSRELYGPYHYQGPFLDGGHTSFFDWDGQKYVLQENHDISAFYRGASLKPVFFHEDGTIIIPENDRWFPGPGRPFRFERSTMGWRSLDGSTIDMQEGKLTGTLQAAGATVVSAPWLYTDLQACSQITVKLKNASPATQMEISIFSRNQGADFWRTQTDEIDWTQQTWITYPIEAHDPDFRSYTLSLEEFPDLRQRLMQVGLRPATNASEGTWEIEEIVIE
ncbi:family 43 glycosylhydrolase [Pontibacter sp. G13]|uniref:family 43 glycosylhydrolase n=1 Tax=Pontibacter sp. G13 TaxID=3074898 RepID=UPI0028899DFE|nr:family 43 glycosylhydrolase [Pontibacter sp. G13]WNJ17336.1 family 43 glycosylhydrolase [Pontibacter sp. G13]